ncbi:MAG TPA: glycosyl hydrolase family 18 protein [bacterium]|nr:glycosyl hydrolase family 18 protein [bacterium]
MVALVLTLPSLSAQEKAGQLAFGEIWAYLMTGEESFLNPVQPITDLCLFSAEINAYGELVGVPDIRKVSVFRGRKHLVVAEIGSYSLMHFCMDPAFPIRDRLVADIILAARPFDGVQIDFEAVPVRDRDNFIEFLGLLKAGLGMKALSVAMPARVSEAGDAPAYARVAAIVDRVIVMAYDEHWSTSEAGPVASMDWCSRVAAYAQSKVGASKLVMGLPLYGRAWGDIKVAKAYKYSGIDSLVADKNVGVFFREKDVPWFQYQQLVTVSVYYDDATSLVHRMGLYKAANVGAVSFWRLGQEDPAVWSHLAITTVSH